MKKIVQSAVITLIISMFFQSAVLAQFHKVDNFVEGIGNEGIKQDVELLMTGYLEPFVDGFSTGLSSGWYNTAKPHKLLGFDVSVTGTGVFIPDEKLLFSVADLEPDFQQLYVEDGGPDASTVAGTDQQVTLESSVTIQGQSIPLASFETPQGADLKYLLVPAAKAGVGLPLKTDLMVRYLPRLEVQKARIGLWGVGLKHSLKQYLPIVKRVPILHLSAMAAFTQLNTSTDVSFKPSDIQSDVQNESPYDFTDQSVGLTMNSFTANLLVSLDIPVLTVYGALGVVSNNSELALYGHYPTSVTYEGGQLQVTGAEVEEDPMTLSFKTDAVDGMIPRVNLGLRLKFAVFTLQAEYVYSSYSMATAGVGISFR